MKMFIKAFLAVVWGIFYCKKLRLKHGKNSHIFLIRGKTADIYLYLRFLKNYLEQNSITNLELTWPSARNVSDFMPENENIKLWCFETQKIIDRVLQKFPNIN